MDCEHQRWRKWSERKRQPAGISTTPQSGRIESARSFAISERLWRITGWDFPLDINSLLNSAAMKNLVGTILPTKESLACSDSYAKRVSRERKRVAVSSPELNRCTRRLVGDEVRYYNTADRYAIVSRTGKVLWFQVTDDGDFSL